MKGGRDGRVGLVVAVAAGIVAVLIVHAGLSHIVTQAVTERFLDHEGRVKQEFLNSFLADGATAGQLFADPAPSPALAAFAAHVRSLPGVVRANIYSPDGFIRHSTEPNLLGVHFGDNDELARSFEGKITSAIEVAGDSGKSEHLALNQRDGEPLIEAYIPVIGAEGAVVAVVEFYRRDAWISDTAALIARWTALAAALASAILAATVAVALRLFRPKPRQPVSAPRSTAGLP